MTKYPIILVHGLCLRESRAFHAFGKIEKNLKTAGYRVYTAEIDAFGSIETNAEQLKDFIIKKLSESGAEKVNVIAHSKGGLDTKYMLVNLDMSDRVAQPSLSCSYP